MKELRVFREGVSQLRWIEAVAGFTRGWVWRNDFARWADAGYLPQDEDDEVVLYNLSETPLDEFGAGLTSLVLKYDGIRMSKWDLEPRLSAAYRGEYVTVPLSAWDVWQLEFILPIMNTYVYKDFRTQLEELDTVYWLNNDIFKNEVIQRCQPYAGLWMPTREQIDSIIQELRDRVAASRYPLAIK